MESERPQVNPAGAVSTQSWGFYRGFQILLALLAWITLNKQSPPSPTSFVWSTYSQAVTFTDGWLAHLYLKYHQKQDAPVAERNSSLCPPLRASLPLHSTPSPPTKHQGANSSYTWLDFILIVNTQGRWRETETSTVNDTVPQDS